MADPRPKRPPAFVASFVLGVVGAVLLVFGFASGVEGLLVAGAAAGGCSLIAALVWRSQLIDAWRRDRGRPQP